MSLYSMYKIILAPFVILMIGALTTNAMAQYDPANGNNDGANQARADWQNGGPMNASCTAHGIQNAGNEQYCFNYKIGYLAEQGALIASK